MVQLIIDTLPLETVVYSRFDEKKGCSYAYFNNGKMLISESGKEPETVEMTEQQREDLKKEYERLRKKIELTKQGVKDFEEELDRYRTY